MQIQILDHWRAEIGELNDELIAIGNAVDKLGYWDAAITQQERENRRDHLAAKVNWLEGQLDLIRRLSGNQPTRFRIPLRDGRPDPLAQDDFTLGFDGTLARLRHLGDPVNLLKELCRQLGVPIEQINLNEPADPLYMAQLEEERQERREFDAGFAELRANVEEYARQQGASVPWAFRDFLACWNTGGYSRDKRGLQGFRAALGEKKLLPRGAGRVAAGAAGLVSKVKAVVSL